MGHEEALATRRACERAVLIAGPTASGKSALALTLADAFCGIIVNADSMQVYRDLRIITARPSPSDEARAPHRLYGHVDAAESYSVGHWLADVRAILAEGARMRRLPIIVGGTGLYFKALTRGLAAVPPVPASIRHAVRTRFNSEGSRALHAELARRDPAAAARLSPGDRARVARALEVVEATGRPLAEWHRQNEAPLLDPAQAIKVFLVPERRALLAAIDARFDAMIAAGAVEEVRALDARGLDPRSPAMRAHGVPWLRRHLAGEMTLADAASEAKRDTKRYTKRQLTWFRHQLPEWSWIAPQAATDAVVEALARLPA
jgi:tRNA dimethylallyltransferase